MRAGKLLLVEDCDEFRILGIEGFSRAGFQVEYSENGKRALEIINGGFKPDIVVTDFNMDELDGVGLAKAIRKDSTVPIIIWTFDDRVQTRIGEISRIVVVDKSCDDVLEAIASEAWEKNPL